MTRSFLVSLLLWSIVAVVPAPSHAMTTLHAGDKIAVSIYNHPELLTQTTVDAGGAVTVPLAGPVVVQGLDPHAAAARIARALAPYVRDVAVDVQIQSQGTSVYVVGGPGGVVTYAGSETLSSALGQLTIGPGVDLHRVSVERDGKVLGVYDASALSDNGNAGPALIPGDTIVFANKPVAVDVRGEVKTPGVTHVNEGATLDDAIAQAGGFTTNAGYGQVRLERDGTNTIVALGGAEAPPVAQSGDTLVVPPAEHISVVGLVAQPGELVLHTRPTLLSAIYYAGGPTKFANLRAVSVMSGGTKKTYDVTTLTHGDVSQNPSLADGDVVFVPQNHAIDMQPIWQALAGLRFFVGL